MKEQSPEESIKNNTQLRTCGLFSNIAPTYTRPLWRELSDSPVVKYSFYTSAKGYAGIKVIDPGESKVINKVSGFDWHFLRNIYINNILIYQVGAVYKCLTTNYDTYIFSGEMQCISTWITALICRMKQKPVFFWGHGFYGNENLLKKTIRRLFYKLADYHLVYGERAKTLMIDLGFNSEKIYSVHNSLDFKLHRKIYSEKSDSDLSDLKKRLFPANHHLPAVIFIGRLTKEKKLGYLLRALAVLKSRNKTVNCIIVGAGSESGSLFSEAKSLDIADLINFYGPCHDELTNARLIMLSDCCVSPGNVGLTAIHCLSFGTPVITHENLSNQGPEAESVIDNHTGLFFKEDDVEDLAEKIDKLIFTLGKKKLESDCIDQVNRFWNPVYQSSVFNASVLDATAKNNKNA